MTLEHHSPSLPICESVFHHFEDFSQMARQPSNTPRLIPNFVIVQVTQSQEAVEPIENTHPQRQMNIYIYIYIVVQNGMSQPNE